MRASGFSQATAKTLLRPLHGVVQRAHHVEPGVIRRHNPDRIDILGAEQAIQTVMRTAIAEIERGHSIGKPLAVVGAAAIDAGDLDIAYADQRLQMEMGDETASHKAYAQRLFR